MKQARISAILFIIAALIFLATAGVSGQAVYLALGLMFMVLGLFFLRNEKSEEERS